jgi:hypothetical protein
VAWLPTPAGVLRTPLMKLSIYSIVKPLTNQVIMDYSLGKCLKMVSKFRRFIVSVKRLLLIYQMIFCQHKPKVSIGEKQLNLKGIKYTKEMILLIHQKSTLKAGQIYFTLLYFTLLYFTLLYFTLLYFTLLYFTLLYFTLLYKE